MAVASAAAVVKPVRANTPAPAGQGALLLCGRIPFSFAHHRIPVLLVIHLGVGKLLFLEIALPFSVRLVQGAWTALFPAAVAADLALRLPLHQMSLARGWTLGPGGRPPRSRAGWMWRYWPYA